MRRYAAVLLDVDGTLVDSNDAHAQAWVEALGKHGFEIAPARAKALIGMGGDKLIELVTGLPAGSDKNQRISKARSELFMAKWLRAVRPLVGSRKLVLRLRADGYQYAIASAAKADELQPLLEIADIADLVPVRTTSSDVEHSKPDPDVIEAAFAQLAAERSRTVMVGDTPYDVRAARDAAIAMIAVTTGGWSVEALAGAVAVFRGPADLAENFPT
jgi:phosphoglycolate phosphatase-like HAD superfamily hydrolase